MRTFLKGLIKDNRGATAIEYGLIAALIAVAIIAAVMGLGSEVLAMWNNISSKTAAAVEGQ